jgi:DNA (cytosine-5)-methyltransferase 1
MGLPDTYKLPESYNDAYHVSGDGVVVNVVRHIARSIVEPLLEANASASVESLSA